MIHEHVTAQQVVERLTLGRGDSDITLWSLWPMSLTSSAMTSRRVAIGLASCAADGEATLGETPAVAVTLWPLADAAGSTVFGDAGSPGGRGSGPLQTRHRVRHSRRNSSDPDNSEPAWKAYVIQCSPTES